MFSPTFNYQVVWLHWKCVADVYKS